VYLIIPFVRSYLPLYTQKMSMLITWRLPHVEQNCYPSGTLEFLMRYMLPIFSIQCLLPFIVCLCLCFFFFFYYIFFKNISVMSWRLSANWTFSLWCVPLIKYASLIHKNIRSVRYSHAPVYRSIRRKTYYGMTHKNNNVSSEGLDRYYHKYPSSSHRTRWDISDNVCLDLQNCRCSVFIFSTIFQLFRDH
jgi:hypothetical protein